MLHKVGMKTYYGQSFLESSEEKMSPEKYAKALRFIKERGRG